MKRDPMSPPHLPHDIGRARDAVVDAARAVIARYTVSPRGPMVAHMSALSDAVAALNAMLAANEAHDEARRGEALAAPMHYVAGVGDRKTLCGLDAYPHGWVGADLEYLKRRVAMGGAICPGCRAAAVDQALDTELETP
jgi:hypothetical protein